MSSATGALLANASIVTPTLKLVWADPAVIADHRQADANRSRPVCSVAELEKHQARSDVLARSHANYLRVPFHRVQSGDENLFAFAVRSIVDGRFTE
jgi:adenylate kinase